MKTAAEADGECDPLKTSLEMFDPFSCGSETEALILLER